MDTLIYKLIFAAIIVIFFASCHRSGKDDNMNDAYDQVSTHPAPETPNKTHDQQHSGTRPADAHSMMDSSANSKTYIDSNPK
jgi:hypothetical protein